MGFFIEYVYSTSVFFFQICFWVRYTFSSIELLNRLRAPEKNGALLDTVVCVMGFVLAVW